jgi:hypothetical protein
VEDTPEEEERIKAIQRYLGGEQEVDSCGKIANVSSI